MNPESIEILNKVKSGEISVEEGARLLSELEVGANPPALESPVRADAAVQAAEGPAAKEPAAETTAAEGPAALSQAELPQAEIPRAEPSQAEDFQPDLGWWKKFWLIPFWVGTGILVLGAMLMGWAFSSQHFFWFYCSWLPMLFGIIVLFLSWWSQQARWVHVRVKDADGSRVAISMPLPLGLAGWVLRIFGRFIPKMDEKVLNELPDMLSALAKEKGPTTVEVDEKDGSRVRVYIV